MTGNPQHSRTGEVIFFDVEGLHSSMLVPFFCMSSWVYYCSSYAVNMMPDSSFDLLGQRIFNGWDYIEHPHKYLLTKEMVSCTGLDLSNDDYPIRVRASAMLYMDNLHRLFVERQAGAYFD